MDFLFGLILSQIRTISSELGTVMKPAQNFENFPKFKSVQNIWIIPWSNQIDYVNMIEILSLVTLEWEIVSTQRIIKVHCVDPLKIVLQLQLLFILVWLEFGQYIHLARIFWIFYWVILGSFDNRTVLQYTMYPSTSRGSSQAVNDRTMDIRVTSDRPSTP